MKTQHETLPASRAIEKAYDLVVCGGGVGGILTAISAARHGLRTALVDDKTSLGGNANGENGVAIDGASFFCFYPNMRETGLVEEMKEAIVNVDPCFRKNLNSPVFLFWCEKEGVDVYSELLIDHVETEGRRVIAVQGTQGGTERRYRFSAGQFVDATGDGTIAAQAGCAFRIGREASAEYGELLAPSVADQGIMGASCGLRASEKTFPSVFKRPDWAYAYEKPEDLPYRLSTIHGKPDHGFWWIEYAGDKNDPIGEYETIRKELLKCVFGVWSYLKNDPKRGMENWSLDAVSVSPAKRESRRVMGDVVLTERDIVERSDFKDTVAYAGWNMDIHVPGGFKSPLKPNVHAFFPWVAPIPLRSLYAKDMDNLWLVGRDMSVSHVALGATRLQATIGATGHAVGIAAAYAARAQKTCRQTAGEMIREIRQTILKDGSFIPGVHNADPEDAAREAVITASSEMPLAFAPSELWLPVERGRALSFPVTESKVQRLQLRLKNEGAEATTIRMYFNRSEHPNHATHRGALAETTYQLAPGEHDITWDLSCEGLPRGLYALLITTEGQVGWQQSAHAPYGCYTYLHKPDHYFVPQPDHYFVPQPDQDIDFFSVQKPVMLTPGCKPVEWVRQSKVRWNYLGSPHDRNPLPLPAVSVTPEQRPYAPAEVISGISHSDLLPELWISAPNGTEKPWLQLAWDTPRTIGEVRIAFDTDLDMPHPAAEPVEYLVKDYDIECRTGQGWETVVSCRNNERRFHIHRFNSQNTTAVKVKILAMHAGGPSARVFEIRCYA